MEIARGFRKTAMKIPLGHQLWDRPRKCKGLQPDVIGVFEIPYFANPSGG